MSIVFYHNPRCSKSRAVHALLLERKLSFDTVDYLKEPPTKSDLTRIVDALDQPAQALLRSGNSGFKALNLDLNSLDKEQIIELIVRNPELLQRPVVLVDNRARIGRPIERVESILP